jgi:Tfp pilus assembly protein PilO
MTTTFLSRPEVRIYGVPVVLLLLAVLLFALLAIPTWNAIGSLRDQITEEEGRVVVLKEKSRKLLDFADQSDLLDRQFALFNQAVTSESKVPELLTQIQSLSDSCGLSVKTLQFGGESTTQEKGRVREVRVQYAAEGLFTQITCLVAAFESASRLIDVESLRYSSSESESGAITLSPEATLIAYYTPEASLVLDTPLTFSFSNATYIRTTGILEALK